jgi:sterol 3beta-glucosyltransferase
MKALLISMGTRGDIEPFLAVAEILKEKDWEVVCVFPEQFREDVEAMDFRFYGFNKEFLELLGTNDAKQVLGGGGSIFSRLQSWYSLARAGYRISKEMVTYQHDVQLKEEPDRVIYHPKCNFALVWGMANPGKSIMLSPIPGMAHPIDHMTVLWGDYGRTLNRLSFWFVNTIKAVTISTVARKYRKYHPDLKITASAIKRQMLEKEETIYTVSPTLFPRPKYWPPQAKVVGYFERNKALNWEPDQRLTEFLAKYPQIVFISFGSMTNPEPKQKSAIIVRVLEKLGVPAIINTSWGGGGLQRIDVTPEHVLFVDNVPYDWLFPKVYAVVHHGGSGTTHMAVKYGCPSLVIPHALDQTFWSRTIAYLRLGPAGLNIRDLNEESFESKLVELYEIAEYKIEALDISERIASESDRDTLYELISRMNKGEL